MKVAIEMERPEGYEEVCDELVAEDAMREARGWIGSCGRPGGRMIHANRATGPLGWADARTTISADGKSNGGPFLLVPRLVVFALRMCLAAGMPSEASNG